MEYGPRLYYLENGAAFRDQNSVSSLAHRIKCLMSVMRLVVKVDSRMLIVFDLNQ